MPPTTNQNPRLSRGRRIVAAGLYLGCLAAAGAIVYPIAIADTDAAAGPIALPPDAEDPLFAPLTLPAGTWTFVIDHPAGKPEWQEKLHHAIGVVSAEDRARLPLPRGVEPVAIRRDASKGITAVITAPTDVNAAINYWGSTGWTVHTRDLDTGRLLHLLNGDRTAVVWVTPAERSHRLLIVLPPPGATSNGGFQP